MITRYLLVAAKKQPTAVSNCRAKEKFHPQFHNGVIVGGIGHMAMKLANYGCVKEGLISNQCIKNSLFLFNTSTTLDHVLSSLLLNVC